MDPSPFKEVLVRGAGGIDWDVHKVPWGALEWGSVLWKGEWESIGEEED